MNRTDSLQIPIPDRRVAGKALVTMLLSYKGRPDTIVLALPRGGVPVAYEIAVARGTDVDQPRNLAKSVTVE